MNKPNNNKFHLKQGTLLRLPGTHIDYNNSNLTDEIAKDILKVSPGSIKYFEKFDKEWWEAHTAAKATEPVAKSFIKDKPEPVTEAVTKDDLSLPINPQQLSVNTLRKIIKNSESVEHITELVRNDTRESVQKFAANRIKVLQTA